MNAHANVQPFLIATLLFVVPLMGFGRRLLDRLIPKNDLDAQRRPRALSMLVYGILRSVMLVLDLYNAPEFFKNWFNPLNVSPSFYSLNLLVSGIYTSMIVYDMANFELNVLGFIHHSVALVGMGLPMTGIELPEMYPFCVYVYRFGTLFATPIVFVLAYYYLGPNEYASLTKKVKMLRYGLLEFRVALNTANIVALAFYITHFRNLPNSLRVILIVMQCGYVPEQVFTAKQVAQWQKRLVERAKALASPITPIATEFARRLSAVALPVAEMTRRLSVSDVKRRLSVSLSITDFRKRLSISSPRSPVSPTSPTSPQPMVSPLNTKTQLPAIFESRQASPIERVRPVQPQPLAVDTRNMDHRRHATGVRSPVSAPY